MYVIGLTGGIGSGKSYVAKMFNTYGIPSLDTDIVSRNIDNTEILNEFGTVDRKLLADIVFNDPEKLKILNKITHKLILAECNKWLAERERENNFAAIIEAPLLFESRFNYLCDYVIAVVADMGVRIARIDSSRINRISKQHDNNFFINNSDFVIYNNPYNDTRLQVDLIYQQLRWV